MHTIEFISALAVIVAIGILTGCVIQELMWRAWHRKHYKAFVKRMSELQMECDELERQHREKQKEGRI